MPEREPRLRPDELSPEQRRLYDAIAGGARARHASIVPVVDADGCLEGPFGALLHAPVLGEVVQSVGVVIREHLSVPARTREIATLLCAATVGSDYELDAHVRLARAAGVDGAEVDALVAGALPAGLDAREGAFATAAVTTVWTDAAYAAVRRELSTEELTEAVVLGGYYRTLAALLAAFGIDSVSDR